MTRIPPTRDAPRRAQRHGRQVGLGISGVTLLLGLVAGPARAQPIERVSVAFDGTEANGDSYDPALSADGRFVVFASEATNLVPNDTNGVRDVFVHDRQTGVTERVSVASDGTEGNGATGTPPALSADGRVVAFASEATNLVPNDTNSETDVFVHDRQTGMTERVSVASGGGETGGSYLFNSVGLSAGGRLVAFASGAADLVPHDTNNDIDIFVHDRQTGVTERVSVASDGTEARGDSSGLSAPVLSADGRFVAFANEAGNLVPGDTNFGTDVFVHDRQTGVTERVSVDSRGTQADRGGDFPDLSADGRFVAFVSDATNLVADKTTPYGDVFVHDRQTGVTERVSVASDGTEADRNSYGGRGALSADGRFVAFASDATNLVVGDAPPGGVFVHDRQTGATERVSAGGNAAISADGRVVAFTANPRSFVFRTDVFVQVRALASTTTTSTTVTNTATTTSGPPTTPTTLPCTSARCTLDAGVTSPACAGEAIPAGVTKNFVRAAQLIDQAETSPAKRAKKLLKRAAKALKRAKAKVARTAKGRKPNISADCAAALRGATDRVLAGLQV